MFTDQAFVTPVKVVLAANVPVMAVEGIITAFALVFLKKVRPEILEVRR